MAQLDSIQVTFTPAPNTCTLYCSTDTKPNYHSTGNWQYFITPLQQPRISVDLKYCSVGK